MSLHPFGREEAEPFLGDRSKGSCNTSSNLVGSAIKSIGYGDKTKQKYDSPNFRLSFTEFVQRTQLNQKTPVRTAARTSRTNSRSPKSRCDQALTGADGLVPRLRKKTEGRLRVGGRWLNRLRDGHVPLGALSMSSLASLLLRYAVAETIYAPLGLKSARGGV
jgi:hypothetical protein